MSVWLRLLLFSAACLLIVQQSPAMQGGEVEFPAFLYLSPPATPLERHFAVNSSRVVAGSPTAPGDTPNVIVLSASKAEANLIHKVEPSYPQMAKITHTQGDVVLRVRIGKKGELNEIKLLSGHPLLVQSAFDAVKQWRYQPYLLNGDPVEVETTITIKYHL